MINVSGLVEEELFRYWITYESHEATVWSTHSTPAILETLVFEVATLRSHRYDLLWHSSDASDTQLPTTIEVFSCARYLTKVSSLACFIILIIKQEDSRVSAGDWRTK